MKVALGVALVGSALLAGCRPGGQGEPSPPGGRQVFRLRPAEVSGSPGGPRREAEARLPVEPPESEVVVEGQSQGEGVAPFERRRVVVNEQLAGDHVPVLQGLGEGERVATRGAIFLLGM